MKMVMLRPSYLPEQSGGNHLAVNLVEDIIAYGHEVEVIVPVSNSFSEKAVKDLGYPVHRITSNIRGNSTVYRIFKYITDSLRLFIKLMRIKDVDLIMSHSMPPILGPLCILVGKLRNVPVLYWEQDIVSESIKTTGITNSSKTTNLFSNIALSLEKVSLKGSNYIVTISEKFKQIRMNQGIDKEKIDVIYNWIDTNEIYPILREENFLFEKYNLNKEKFIITYCGNLGIPQNVEIMIDAAKKLERHTDIEFIIFGGGSRESEIKSYIQKKQPSNLKMYPLEPLENAREVYNVGDIGLVIAKEGTSNNGFPSKTWSILSAGQSIISCFDIDSELSTMIRESNAGISVEPDSSEKLKEAILKIYHSEDRGKSYGENARDFVKGNHSRELATYKFINIINELTAEEKL